MKKYFDDKADFIFKLFIVIFSIALQLFYIPNLPEKYFYDSIGILNYSVGIIPSYLDSSYRFASYFFKIINVFGFTTFQQWSYFFSIFFSIVISIFLFKFKKLTIIDYVFIYSSIVLANMYIFRIGKDIIQFIIWIIVFCTIKIKNQKLKNIMLFIIFLFEAIFFRSYYILIFIIYEFIKKLLSFIEKKQKKHSMLKMIIISLIIFIFGLVLLKYIKPDLYYELTNLRYSINKDRLESADAITIINNVFENNNVIFYIINYFINYVRMLFPKELITKGGKYVIFLIYQVMFSLQLFLSFKDCMNRKNDIQKEYLCLLIGYLCVANLFEPDFGSLIRHETALFFIFISLFYYNKNKSVMEVRNEKS